MKAIERHVAARLRALREKRGVSQRAVSIDLGVTPQQVQNLEHGRDRITAGKLLLIARKLDVDVSYFFEGAPP